MTDAASADPPPHNRTIDLTGRQLGDYRLLHHIGRGAMAEVYLAEQLSLGRRVAFKVLRAELATDETYLKRFELEARAAASLVHAAIVQIYEVGCVDGVHFIAQEYVQGQNLAELLRRRGTLPLDQAVGVMRQVAVALAKAGEHGIVHRDIKPDNLMLSTSGEVKVADFGLARAVQGDQQQKLTQIGITMGSPLYMSPEQAEGKPLDTRSDIYSFGATCYEMLGGRPPFQGETALSVAVQHVRSQPPPLDTLRPDLPPELCNLIHRMLAKSPARRQANGGELLRELRRLPIKQSDTDWPEALDPLNTTESVALSSARQAATQHLARVMSEDRVGTPIYRRPAVWLVALLAVLLGGWLALPTHEPALLDEQDTSVSQVERFSTAQRQYTFALRKNTEAALRSVADYFPTDTRYVDLAAKQLADRLLQQRRYREALAIFDDFASRATSDPDYHAYGLAGQFIVYTLLDEVTAADKALDALTQQGRAGDPSPLSRLEKFDPTMARRVEQVR